MSTDDEWWTTTDVAAHLGILVGTVSAYRHRGQMPAPDKTLGQRGHLWRPGTIMEWQQSRPRVGVDPRPYAVRPSLMSRGGTRYERRDVWTDAGRAAGSEPYCLLRNVTHTTAKAVVKALVEAGWYANDRHVAS